MTAREVLDLLEVFNITLTPDPDGSLKLRLPADLAEPERSQLIHMARTHKDALLEALEGAQEPKENPAAWASRMCAKCASLAISGDSATCCWPLAAERVNRKDMRLAPYLRPLEVGAPCPAEGRGWDRWKQ